MDYPACPINEQYHLLIPSRFPPVPLYTRLGSAEIQKAAAALEERTNPRLREMARMARSGQSSGKPDLTQNWNLAPFAYPNPEGTTYLGPSFRVLELAQGEREALAIAVLRREAFLSASNEPAVNIEMRTLVRPVRGRFVDLTGMKFETDQATRWRLGAELYEQDVQGVVFQRPDVAGARLIAIFDGAAVGRVLQGAHYRFVWDGKAVRTIGNLATSAIIDRDELFSELAGQAAA